MEWFRRKTVSEVSSCSKGFRPIRSRGMRFYQEGSGDFKQGAIFSFCNTIFVVRCQGKKFGGSSHSQK